jgi:hypothetical protein
MDYSIIDEVKVDCKPIIKSSYTVSVGFSVEAFFGVFGTKETITFRRSWMGEINSIVDATFWSGPYFYDGEECLNRSLEFKERLERTIQSLAIPIPVRYVLITKGDERPKDEEVRKFYKHTRPGQVNLWFVGSAAHCTQAWEKEGFFKTYPFENKESCVVEERKYDVQVVGEDRIVSDAIVCTFSSVDEELMEAMKATSEELYDKKGTLVCICDVLDFDVVYEEWKKRDCSCVISKVPELLFSNETLYVEDEFQTNVSGTGNLELSNLAVPYCKLQGEREYEVVLDPYLSCTRRIYKK